MWKDVRLSVVAFVPAFLLFAVVVAGIDYDRDQHLFATALGGLLLCVLLAARSV
jgi:hypothetical protein